MRIIYRAYAGETDGNLSVLRPAWFSKLKCWKSFWSEFNSCDVAVLWDGDCSGDFYEYIKSTGVEIKNYGKIGNKGGLIKTYELLKESGDEIVATVEDDFLFLPGCLEILLEGFKIGFPLQTPYEHMDRYRNVQNDHSYWREQIFLGSKNYFRSVESTTGTCFFKKVVFDIVYPKLLHHNINDRAFFRDIMKDGIRLFSPQPGCATHVCIDRGIDLMSPFIDWEAFNKSIVI